MDRSTFNTPEAWGAYGESSVNTPGYQKRVVSGDILPHNPYVWWRIDGSSPLSETYNGLKSERNVGGWNDFRSGCYAGQYTNQIGGKKSNKFHSVDEIHGLLRNELIANVRDSPVDLGVSLGEYRETAKFVAGAMDKAADMYRAVRKHDFSQALRYLTGRKNQKYSDVAKAAADAHLGYSYAVRPLMNDVYGVVEKLTENRNPWVDVRTVRASITEQVSVHMVHNYSNGTTTTNIGGGMRGTAKLQFFVDNPLLFTLDQIGVVNPLSLGWELIPYSFVVDWFLPIGDALRGVVPPPGISNIRYYTYVKGRGTASRDTSRSSPKPGWNTSGKSRETFKDRKVGQTWPSYFVEVPDLSLSYNELASGMALLTRFLK